MARGEGRRGEGGEFPLYGRERVRWDRQGGGEEEISFKGAQGWGEYPTPRVHITI